VLFFVEKFYLYVFSCTSGTSTITIYMDLMEMLYQEKKKLVHSHLSRTLE